MYPLTLILISDKMNGAKAISRATAAIHGRALFKSGDQVISKKDQNQSPLVIIKVYPMFEMYGKDSGKIREYKYLVKNVDDKRFVF